MTTNPVPIIEQYTAVPPVYTIPGSVNSMVSNVPVAALQTTAIPNLLLGGNSLMSTNLTKILAATPVTDKARSTDPKIQPTMLGGQVIGEIPPALIATETEAKKKFGDTVVGKILKGAAIAGGSVLGLGAVIGGITGATAGTGALAGAVGGVKSVVQTVGGAVDKVGQAAVNLVTGTTKEERTQIKEVKAEAKAAADQLEQVDRLIKAGATPEDARNMVGIPAAQLQEYDGKPITTAGIDTKTLLYIGGALLAVFLLPKLLKTR